eukprot:8206131-Alexandrium_andersonii.AAC.1
MDCFAIAVWSIEFLRGPVAVAPKRALPGRIRPAHDSLRASKTWASLPVLPEDFLAKQLATGCSVGEFLGARGAQ